MKKKKYSGAATSGKYILNGMERNKIAEETFKKISELNVNRGEIKGFLFENLHAKELNYELSKKGMKAIVIDNNGVADISIVDLKTNKLVERIQAKCGYERQSVGDFKRYIDDGQTLVINKDADKLSRSLDNKGISYKKSNITDKEVSRMAKNMKKEGKYLNTKNAKVTSSIYKSKEILSNCHNAGVNAAKAGACFGAGMSVGGNIVDVLCGDKDLGEASVDIAKDTVVAGVSGYVVGAAGTAIASTTAGTAVIGAATTAGAAIASTTVGGAAVAAGTAVGGAVAAGGAAVGGAVAAGLGAAGGAVAAGGAAVGGAMSAVGLGAAGGAVAAGGAAVAAGAAAVGAAAVAAAPVVAVGVAVGAIFSLGKKIFGD